MSMQALGVGPQERDRINSLRSILPEVNAVDDWAAFSSSNHVWFIAARDLNDSVVRRIRALNHDPTCPPVLLATLLEARNLVHLAKIRVDDVIDFHTPVEHWKRALTVLVEPADGRDLAAAFRMTLLPPLLRLALIRLAVTVPPFLTVTSVAESLDCSVSTLNQQFRHLDTGYRLEDAVDWFVLVHYGWEAPRRAVVGRRSASGPSQRTLDQMAARLLGTSRKAIPRPDLADHLLIRQILDSPVSDKTGANYHSKNASRFCLRVPKMTVAWSESEQ